MSKKKKSLKYDDIDPAIQACLGMHECFRRLGFTSNEIHVGLGRGLALVVLRTQGKEFVADVAETSLGREEFETTWIKTATAVRDGCVSQSDLKRMFENCIGATHSVEFLLALRKKGIKWRGCT